MRGVSEVIAIILILMITISLAGLAYMFMSTTMSDVTSSAGSTVDTTTSSMLTSFIIESIDVTKVYVRNTGQNAITSLSVYVNDEPATCNVTTPIASGAVGTITIYSFIPDGATVKVTSPNGFSTSKVAQPCDNAVGCWDFNEGTGTMAYDSSPYGNSAAISGAAWTTGNQGNALQFDGSNDYVDTYPNTLNVQGSMTWSVLFKMLSYPTGSIDEVLRHGYKNASNSGGYLLSYRGDVGTYWDCGIRQSNGNEKYPYAVQQSDIPLNAWTFVSVTANGTHVKTYINGILKGTAAYDGTIGNGASLGIGAYTEGGTIHDRFVNAVIDEVRIYNRAIY